MMYIWLSVRGDFQASASRRCWGHGGLPRSTRYFYWLHTKKNKSQFLTTIIILDHTVIKFVGVVNYHMRLQIIGIIFKCSLSKVECFHSYFPIFERSSGGRFRRIRLETQTSEENSLPRSPAKRDLAGRKAGDVFVRFFQIWRPHWNISIRGECSPRLPCFGVGIDVETNLCRGWERSKMGNQKKERKMIRTCPSGWWWLTSRA